MEILEEKTVDMLNKKSVSILTKKFIELDGLKQQVGDNHRRAYVNSEIGRKELADSEPTDVQDSVFAIWGDEPTVEEHE